MPWLQILFPPLIGALILWAISQFPLDATIVKVVRVVIIVAVVLYELPILIAMFDGYPYTRAR